MPVADADADRDAGLETDADADSIPDANPDTEADPDLHPDANSDPDANADADPDPRVDQPRGRRLAGKPRSQRDHRDVDAVPVWAVERLRAG